MTREDMCKITRHQQIQIYLAEEIKLNSKKILVYYYKRKCYDTLCMLIDTVLNYLLKSLIILMQQLTTPSLHAHHLQPFFHSNCVSKYHPTILCSIPQARITPLMIALTKSMQRTHSISLYCNSSTTVPISCSTYQHICPTKDAMSLHM